MKRKVSLILIVALCLFCLSVALIGCNKNEKEEQNDNICRITQKYYAGESEAFAVSIEWGRREKNFIADGIASDVVDFVEICIQPLKSNEYTDIQYTLQDENHTFVGEVTSGNYGDFKASIALDFIPTKVLIGADGAMGEVFLSDVLQDALSSTDVINIAKKEFQTSIDEEYAQGKAEREIYVKLITADRTNYYYYVSFIGDGVDYWAVLVDMRSGEILSKK